MIKCELVGPNFFIQHELCNKLIRYKHKVSSIIKNSRVNCFINFKFIFLHLYFLIGPKISLNWFISILHLQIYIFLENGDQRILVNADDCVGGCSNEVWEVLKKVKNVHNYKMKKKFHFHFMAECDLNSSTIPCILYYGRFTGPFPQYQSRLKKSGGGMGIFYKMSPVSAFCHFMVILIFH